MEVLKTKKRQLETGDTKPKLVGHVELDEIGEVLKMEAELEKPDEETEGGGAPKRRVTQSVAAIQDTNGRRTLRSMKSGGLLLQERSLWQVQV